ncbi:WecB/TagA/CpsF family glycosyltransferase [Ancylobacter sp. VNQ12]|uniref:WecB/TagA/CpsF family glycosyltransferase n=1 Tax=Ancylobacter sp. VNQ12 TaxID=3400920 RepID=UPI003BFCAB4F
MQTGLRDISRDAVDTQPEPETAMFLGVPIALLDAGDAARLIAARPAQMPFTYVVTPNAAHFTRLNEVGDDQFRAAYARAWLCLLDGQLPRGLARLLFGLSLPLAAGSDVTLRLLDAYVRPDDALTVIGGSAELCERLKQRFGLTRVAWHNPPMGLVHRPDAIEACVDFIVAHPARFVFFCVGTPQGEYVALRTAERGTAVGCGLCVGSSLNFATGMVSRAPRLVRQAGLEWAYRLARNPLRHWRRVFVDSLPVLWTIARARLNPAAFGMAGGRDRAGE